MVWCNQSLVSSKRYCKYSVPEGPEKRHYVTYVSKDRNGMFKVHTKQGIVEFIPHESELHYLDLKDNEEAGVALVTTIRENFEGYTKKQVEGAINACHLQAMLGHPSRKDFKGIVHVNLIVNCPMTTENISHTHQLCGENLARFRGKQCAKNRASGNGICPGMRDVIQANKYVTLTADVMYVNNLPFVITEKNRIDYCQVHA